MFRAWDAIVVYDLPICNHGILKTPRPLQSILQMVAMAQQPRRPIAHNGARARGRVSRRGVFADDHRDGAARGSKQEGAVADELARERDDRSRVADEQDPLVGRGGEASLDLGDKDGHEACETVVQGGHVLALARRIPHRGP